MAASFFKWLVVPLMMFPLLSARPLKHADVKNDLHPFYLAVTEINENSKDKTLEITAKIFTDDFEKVLGDNYKAKVNLVEPADRAAMDRFIGDYIQKRLQLIVNDKATSISYLGYEHDSEAVYCFLEAKNINTIQKMSVRNSLLHDLNEYQINIMHVMVNGKRQSTKLDFPSQVANFNF